MVAKASLSGQIYAHVSENKKIGWRQLSSGDAEERRFFALLSKENLPQTPADSRYDKDSYLKLNVGGTSFHLEKATIDKRSTLHQGLLYRFSELDHPQRFPYCTTYLPQTNEYFFERSALLFRPIYNYYITGLISWPPFPCTDLFRKELDFWGVLDQFSPLCCHLHAPGILPSDTQVSMNTDPFQSVAFGQTRRFIWNIIEEPHSSMGAKVWSSFMLLILLLTTVTLLLGSVKAFQVQNGPEMQPHPVLTEIETVCIVIFTVEYLAKLVVTTERKKVFLEPLNVIDLLAIGPFYIELGLQLTGMGSEQFRDVKWALLTMRVLRVMRVVRLLKLGRHCTGLRMFGLTLRRSGAQLGMTGMAISVGIMFFSCMVYFMEKDAKNTKFVSIPAAFWWCLVTISTVGYGDMYPETILGRIIGGTAIASGVLVVALPVTIVVQNYMQLREDLAHEIEKV